MGLHRNLAAGDVVQRGLLHWPLHGDHMVVLMRDGFLLAAMLCAVAYLAVPHGRKVVQAEEGGDGHE